VTRRSDKHKSKVPEPNDQRGVDPDGRTAGGRTQRASGKEIPGKDDVDQPERSLTRQAVSGVAISSVAVVVQFSLQLGVTAVLARLVSPAEFGLVAAGALVMAFCRLFVEIGVGPALVQRSDLRQSHINAGFTISVLFGVVMAGLLALAAPLLAAAFGMPRLTPLLQVFAIGFLIQAPAVVPGAMVQRALRYRVMATVGIISYITGFAVVGITVAVLGGGAWALVAAALTQMLVAAIATYLVQPIPMRFTRDTRSAAQLVRFGGGYTATSLASYFADNLDNMVVARVLGAQALGFYNRAFQFLAIPVEQGASVLDRVLFPLMSRVGSDKDRLSVAYRRVVSLMAFLALPMTVAFVVLAPEIVHVMLGNGWDPVILPFQILALATLPRMGSKMARSLAKATGAVYRSAWRTGVFAVLILAGALAGANWGLVGVAVAVVGANIVAQGMTVHLSLKESGLRWTAYFRAHAGGAAVAALALAVAWPLASFLRSMELLDILVLLIVAAIAGLVSLASCRLWPAIFLGSDGRWAATALRRRAW